MYPQYEETVNTVLSVLDITGIFVFALSGAWLAARRAFDLVGTVALGMVTGLAGGIVRDVLVGDLPPLAIQREIYLFVPVVAALAVVVAPGIVQRFGFPVLVLDAIGLGLFAAVGAAKAVDFGVGVWAATMIGVISAVGGGILRDLLAGVTPQVFGRGSQLYATPAALGAFAVALLWERMPASPVLVVGAMVGVMTIRLLAVRYGWHLPGPPRRLAEDDPERTG